MTARNAAKILQDAAPDSIHGAYFGTHCCREDSIEAERSARTLIQLGRECTHKARKTEVGVAATRTILETSTKSSRPLADILFLTFMMMLMTWLIVNDHYLLLLLLLWGLCLIWWIWRISTSS
jgi:hypothetical protein